MKPLISIVIPTFNRYHLLGDTIDSIISQSYTNWECIVVDDGSKDYTSELMEFYCMRDDRIKFHHRPGDRAKGANSCRNYGYEISKGEYIQWFDDDDIMLEDFIEKKLNLFEENLDFVICTGYFVDHNLKNRNFIPLNDKENLFKNYALWKIKVLTPSVLFKRSFLEKKSLFKISQSRSQERELFSRFFFQTDSSCYQFLEEPLFMYRQHEGSKTFRDKKYNFNYYESHVFVYLENYRRSLTLEDARLSEELYRWLIFFVFQAIKNKHTKNYRAIMICFRETQKRKNLLKYFQVLWLVSFCWAISHPSYRLEKYLKNINLFNGK